MGQNRQDQILRPGGEVEDGAQDGVGHGGKVLDGGEQHGTHGHNHNYDHSSHGDR